MIEWKRVVLILFIQSNNLLSSSAVQIRANSGLAGSASRLLMLSFHVTFSLIAQIEGLPQAHLFSQLIAKVFSKAVMLILVRVNHTHSFTPLAFLPIRVHLQVEIAAKEFVA